MVHGSLFSGIGGFDLAAGWMGWHNAFHCEINDFCNKILSYWFPYAELFTDITKTDFSGWRGKINVLTGGFPCQPFSIAGGRKGSDDDRYLWPEMLRAIREIRPDWIVGENVGGILSMVQSGQEVEVAHGLSLFGEDNRKRVVLRQGYVVETICSDLESEGYSVQPLLIPACAVGAPHRRDRVWFIAQRNASPGTRGSTDLGAPGKYEGVHEADRLLEWNEISELHNADNARPAVFQVSSHADGGRCHNGNGNREKRQAYFNGQGNPEKNKREGDERQSGAGQTGRADVHAHCIGLERRFHEEQKGIPRIQPAIPDTCILRNWENFPTQSPVCGGDDGISSSLDSIAFSKWRQESVKAYGNAIVPQVAYEIFKAIELTANRFENEKRNDRTD